jgi:predicted nucleotidyltransferase
MIVPIMGNPRKANVSPPRPYSLADALFSTVQQRVLTLLFGQPDRSFYTSEVIRLVGSGSGAVQREIARLERSGLIAVRRTGAQKHYQANPGSPLFGELCSIVRKTLGLAEPIRLALSALKLEIKVAFVYGSVARRKDATASDIDLMVLSDSLTYSQIMGALDAPSNQLGRPVNPTIYSVADWSRRVSDGNAFVARVLQEPKLWIIGGERDLPA